MRTGKRRRRSRSAAFYIPAGILLIVIVIVLGTGVFLRVVDIDVVGASRYSKEEIIQASGISTGENIMFLDTGAAVRRIRMAMPYIAEVKIEPVLPGFVRITVRESVAVAEIEYLNTALLIDSSGRVLGKVDNMREGLVEVKGFVPSEAEIGSKLRAASGSETQLTSLTEVLAAFEKEDMLDSVSYLDVTHIATISFGYAGRFTVILGGSGNVAHKLDQLPGIVEMIDSSRPKGEMGVINMSDPTGEWRFNSDW